MRRVLRTTCLLVSIPLASWAGQSAAPRDSADAGSTVPHDLPRNYTPLHKGGVGLSTGLYYRENEDLFVPGVPALILRRTYVSGYRASKQFGIGALHNGEEYLIGDGQRFQWLSLILARGTRVHFRRTSAGHTLADAAYVHDDTQSEWHGATVIWTGLTWVLERLDGTRLIFRGCGPQTVCSIVQSRDADGHTIYYRRNLAGTLVKMDDGADRWISFDYDGSQRITRAFASTGRSVQYAYDARGRLTSALASDGLEYRYTYTDLDELATIDEPDASIRNGYADGRCIYQVNHSPDSDPYIFDFTYRVEDGRVVQTTSRTSDGTFEIYTWDDSRRVVTETRGKEGYEPLVFNYQRDPVTRSTTALSLTCPDLGAGRLRRTASVTSGNEDRVKADLVAQCFASAIGR